MLQAQAAPVHSVRDLKIGGTESARQAGLAFRRPVRASSSHVEAGADYRPESAVHGAGDTRWSSEFSDPQWLAIDLGTPRQFSRVVLEWEGAYARSYAIQVSDDGASWREVYSTTRGEGDTEELKFAPVTARWVRFHGTKRATPYGYSLWEMKVLP